MHAHRSRKRFQDVNFQRFVIAAVRHFDRAEDSSDRVRNDGLVIRSAGRRKVARHMKRDLGFDDRIEEACKIDP